MRNPFVYGKVARGECFADRAREVEELSADILAGQNVILFSPRRYGKTSLILEVLDQLRTQGVLTVYLDLFRITSEEEFVAAYAREIARLCGGGMKAVLKKVRELLPRLIPRVSLKGEGFEVEFTFDLRVEREPLLADLFEAVATIARERGRPAAVVFDEFQEIARWDKGEKIQRTMRAHFQHHPEVSYVFMGSKRHLMHELFQNKNRPFYRFGKHFPLGKIPKEESRPSSGPASRQRVLTYNRAFPSGSSSSRKTTPTTPKSYAMCSGTYFGTKEGWRRDMWNWPWRRSSLGKPMHSMNCGTPCP